MGRQKQKPAAPFSSLPLDLAPLVCRRLAASERAALAAACRAGRQWVRAAGYRASFGITLTSQKELQEASQQLARAGGVRTLVLGRGGGPLAPSAPLLSLSMRRLGLSQLEALNLMDIVPAPHMLRCLAHLPRLSSLALASSSPKRRHRINADGALRELRRCASLRRLTVVNIAGDAGLEALTQLQELTLELPDHSPRLHEIGEGVVDQYICRNCGDLHPDGLMELLHAETDWDDRVKVGPALHALAGLRSLDVDLQSGNAAINNELNSLELGPAAAAMTGLTGLTLRNAARPVSATVLLQHFNYLPGLRSLDAHFWCGGFLPAFSRLEGAHDAAGRPVVLHELTNRHWKIERELPAE